MKDRDLDPPEETIRPEPDYDETRQHAIDDVYHIGTLPNVEDSFSLDKRLTMMINHISDQNHYDKRQLINLLKDCAKFVKHTESMSESIVSLTETLEATTYGKVQGE